MYPPDSPPAPDSDTRRGSSWREFAGEIDSPTPDARSVVIVERRTPGAVKAVLTLLILAAIGLGSMVVLSAQNGNNWRVEAEYAAKEIRDLETAPRAEITELRNQLERSEADVVQLQERLEVLADEKAQARDRAAIADNEAEFLQELTVRAADITKWLTACIEYQDNWAEVLVNIGTGYSYEEAELERFIKEMSTICARAQVGAEALQEFVEQ